MSVMSKELFLLLVGAGGVFGFCAVFGGVCAYRAVQAADWTVDAFRRLFRRVAQIGVRLVCFLARQVVRLVRRLRAAHAQKEAMS